MTLEPPRTKRDVINALIGSWELISSIFVSLFACRFLLWRFFDGGSSPFESGLFHLMELIHPYPETWGALMLLSVPAALLITVCASDEIRIVHRLWLAFWWGMFAGANIPLGVDRTVTTFGLLLLWGFPIASILQTYALAERYIDQQRACRRRRLNVT